MSMFHQAKKVFAPSNQYKKPLILFSLMAFFWTLFDSIISYVAPLFIEREGISLSMMGIIIGTSSVTGALFDFVFCRLFKQSDFRRVLLVMFAICFVYPLFLWQGQTIWMFLFAMALWGIYFDLYGFGLFDFIEKNVEKKENTAGFSFVQIFRTLAKLIAPLVLGFVLIDPLNFQTMSLAWVVLLFGFLFFLALIFSTKKNSESTVNPLCHPRLKNILQEMELWRKIGRVMFPILYMSFFINVIDAFFWTLAPLYGKSVGFLQFGGLFLVAYSLPALLVGWFVGNITKKYGKKKSAFVSLLLGSLALALVGFAPSPIITIVLVFVFSCFLTVTYPAISGVYADNISEALPVELEIEGLADWATNFGYIIGPILAGVLADIFSIPVAFSFLGILGAISAVCLLLFTPRHITVSTKRLHF